MTHWQRVSRVFAGMPFYDRLSRWFMQQSFVRNVMVVASGTAFNQALNIVFTPVVTRLYTPEHFGALGVYTSIMTLVGVLVSLKYELALVLPEDEAEAANLLVFNLAVAVIFAVITGISVFLLHASIVRWIDTPELAPLLWLLPIHVLLTGLYLNLSNWLVRLKNFVVIARANIIQGIAGNAVRIGLGLFGAGTSGLIISQIIQSSGANSVLARKIWRRNADVFKKISFAEMRRVAWRYRRFPFISVWSALINSAGLGLPVIFMATLFDDTVLGWFAFSVRLVSMPIGLMGQATANVYLGTAAQLKLQNPSALRRLFVKASVRLFLVGGGAIGALAVVAPPLFGFVFGEAWEPAGHYVRLLSPLLIAQFVDSPLSLSLILLERQDLQLYWDIGRLASVVISFLIADWLKLSPSATLVIYSLSGTLAYMVHYVIQYELIRRYERTATTAQVDTGLPSVDRD